MPRPLPTKRRRPALPKFVEPMLCKDVRELPAPGDWLYEVKRDGCRVIAIKDGAKVTLLSRKGKPLDYPEAGQALKQLPANRVVIDCEVVSVNGHSASKPTLRLYAFDLLHVNGRDVTGEPIEKRKERLCSLTMDSAILFCPSLECEPEFLIEEVRRLALEAVIAKRKGSSYEPGACSGTWVQLRVDKAA